MVRLLLTALLLAWASTAQAATYYVAITGDNGADGSSGAPWLTIAKCAATLTAGDTCIIRDGTYTENPNESTDGSSGSRITYQAENRHLAILNGQFTVGGDYVTIDGLKVIGQPTQVYGVDVAGANVEVKNCHITETGDMDLGKNNVGIRGDDGSEGLLISGNYISRFCFGITVQADGATVTSNEITDLRINSDRDVESGQCGDVDYIRPFGANHTFTDNRLHGINRDYTYREQSTDPEDMYAHVDCFQTFDNGGLNRALTNTLIERNTCSDAGSGMMFAGAVYQASGGLTVRNNVLFNISSWCADIKDFANVSFFNNTCDGTGTTLGLYCRDTGPGRASCEWKNNIVYGLASPYGFTSGGTPIYIDGNASAFGKNNLLYKSGVTLSTTGYANDVVNQDPLFVSSSERRYQIQAGSPAKDSGASIAGWSAPNDRDGSPRPQGATWDIGAYEYGYLPNPPTTPRKPEQ